MHKSSVSRSFGRRNLLVSGPLLTPLLDVIFLVLIFFMVHNSPAQRSLGVEAPYMASAPVRQATDGDVLLLAVQADLSYTIQVLRQGQQVLAEWQAASSAPSSFATNLQQQLATLQQQRNTPDKATDIWQQVQRIRVRADQSLSYATVVAVCELLTSWKLPLELDVSDLPQIR